MMPGYDVTSAQRFALKSLVFLPDTRRRLLASLDNREYQARLAAARAANDTEAVQDLQLQKQQDDIDTHDWTEIQFTRRLTREARRLKVSVPYRPFRYDEESEYWRISQIHGEWYLTQKGIDVYRDAIRAEEKSRREEHADVRAWMTLVAASIAAVGSIVAACAGLYKALRP